MRLISPHLHLQRLLIRNFICKHNRKKEIDSSVSATVASTITWAIHHNPRLRLSLQYDSNIMARENDWYQAINSYMNFAFFFTFHNNALGHHYTESRLSRGVCAGGDGGGGMITNNWQWVQIWFGINCHTLHTSALIVTIQRHISPFRGTYYSLRIGHITLAPITGSGALSFSEVSWSLMMSPGGHCRYYYPGTVSYFLSFLGVFVLYIKREFKDLKCSADSGVWIISLRCWTILYLNIILYAINSQGLTTPAISFNTMLKLQL